MKEPSAYRTEEEKLSEDRMQFWVRNRYPQYPDGEAIKIRAQVEDRLFAIFEKMQQRLR